ncbi:hypothetical protein SZ55_2106 [Pseudomonas sp. FeS53a]|nr:hypothetical protein SZ55_2106 [Pseudomonas sp. FeS53a]
MGHGRFTDRGRRSDRTNGPPCAPPAFTGKNPTGRRVLSPCSLEAQRIWLRILRACGALG